MTPNATGRSSFAAGWITPERAMCTAMVLMTVAAAIVVAGCMSGGTASHASGTPTGFGPVAEDASAHTMSEGRRVFRFETFGDEEFWTDKARLHEVIEQSISPAKALAAGLKVDVDAIPADVAAAIKAGKVDLESPATTVTLLKLDAVVGVKGLVETVNGKDRLVRVGITCALCHSTVDDSFQKGIGHRRDGWPNRDLDVGAIIAMSPAIPAAQKAVYQVWGPGRYDPRFNIDGKSTPLVLPPIYGLAAVRNETFTAEGPIGYWNAYVAVTQMHGHGVFRDDRLGIDVRNTPDMVGPMLPALRAYQHSLESPKPPAGSFDTAAAARGRTVFSSSCLQCHADIHGTDNNAGVLHAPSDTGMDAAYALRTTTKAYRTTPLRGLWQHPPYFHDGSAATLEAVVDHYDGVRKLALTAAQRADLVQFLRTL
jgi:hypothetical protein